jgi:glucokinase
VSSTQSAPNPEPVVPVVLGLDFGGTKIALAVCEAYGERLGDLTIQTRAGDGAHASLARAVEAARELLGATAPGRRLAAIGVCTLGIPGDDGVALSPAIPGWSDLALARELRAAFPGTEVRVANDVRAAAQVEAESGALKGCDPGIYVNLGTGLAVAIVANGAVVSGRNGAAGEIGYNLRSLADVGLREDQRLPLEEIVSGRALMREANELFPHLEGAAELFAKGDTDPLAAGLLDRFVSELSFHLVNLAIAVDPVRIAVGGGMVRSWDALHDGLRRALDAAVPYPPELVRAAYPFDAPLMGAVALGVTAAREARAGQAPQPAKSATQSVTPQSAPHVTTSGSTADTGPLQRTSAPSSISTLA